MAEDMESIPTVPTLIRLNPGKMLDSIRPLTACRRCGQDGNFAARCQGNPMLFCWIRGRRDVSLTLEPTRQVATVFIGGKVVNATVDTGAAWCLIRENVAASITHRSTKHPDNSVVTKINSAHQQLPELQR